MTSISAAFIYNDISLETGRKMMSTSRNLSNLSARLEGIGHILRDRRISLPQYQRPYSWALEQVQVFWNDLRVSMQSPNPDYFLGTLLLSAEGGTRNDLVIDGQQRLATTALLLASFRDEFRDAGEYERGLSFQSEYLTYMDLHGGKMLPRLVLSDYDNHVYKSIALGELSAPADLAPSAQRLLDAYRFLKEQVKQEIELANSDWIKKIIEWSEFLELHAKVVVLDVPTSTDAFMIFETLNDRGVALSVADLLKNYLYGLLKSESMPSELLWDKMIGTLNSTGDEQLSLDFLRHYWSSWYGVTRERDLYRSFRAKIRTSDQVVSTIENLAEGSSKYLAFVNSDPSFWLNTSVTGAEAETFSILKIVQSRPLFLAALDSFKDGDISSLIHSVISIWIRISITGKNLRSMEKVFADAAVRVRLGTLKNTADICQYLDRFNPSDAEFFEAFKVFGAPNTRLTRYILLAYQNYVQSNSLPFLLNPGVFARSEVERLLPVYSNTSDSLSLKTLLGNFVVTPRSRNIRLTSGDFLEKKDVGLLPHLFTFPNDGALSLTNDGALSLTSDPLERQYQIAKAAPLIWKRET